MRGKNRKHLQHDDGHRNPPRGLVIRFARDLYNMGGNHMKRKYIGLFEDEVSAVIREAGPEHTIIHGFFSYSPAHMINDDGIYTSSAGLYTVRIDGRRAGYIHRARLVDKLAHETFEVLEGKK